jgi:hypothetical protein
VVSSEFSGTVFLIFEKIKFKQLFLEAMETSTFNWFNISYRGLCSQEHLLFDGKQPLIIQEADHPDDIFWYNQDESFSSQVKFQVISLSIQVLLIGVSFVIVFFLNQAAIDPDIAE